MSQRIRGIHHVTAIAGEPAENLDFYARVLGLRLVKKTVNFDDPGTYHLYFGDREGSPGTIMTFFPWPLARRGSRGTGQVTVTSFAVPAGSLGFWRQRLEGAGTPVAVAERRFGEEILSFLDPDGLVLELVARDEVGELPPWEDGPVPAERAIRGFSGVSLDLAELEPTAELLKGVFGFREGGAAGRRHRLLSDAPLGGRVDLLHRPYEAPGRIAAGTVHHVAWRVEDEADQLDWRARLVGRGLHVTRVLDRQYFRSIYFREPGGVLFEIATDRPGFTTDEAVEELGSGLELPPWLERRRREIEAVLPDLSGVGAAAGGGS